MKTRSLIQQIVIRQTATYQTVIYQTVAHQTVAHQTVTRQIEIATCKTVSHQRRILFTKPKMRMRRWGVHASIAMEEIIGPQSAKGLLVSPSAERF